MGASDLVGEVLGIPEPSARFLLALFSSHLFAFVFRAIMSDQHARAKSFFFSISGMWMMYYIYGIKIWHSALDIAAVYAILVLWGGTLLSVTLTWIITMSHLVLGYAWVMWSAQVHPIEWTIPHCVLVLKLIGLSYNLYDGRKKTESLSEDFKKNAIYSVPSIVDVTGFCYFYGSVLAGPQMTFVRYQNFVEGRLFNWNKTPSSIRVGVQRLLTGVFFSVFFSLTNQYYPFSMLSSEAFANEESLLYKLFLVFVCGKIALWRYIAVWLIAEGSCITTGLSYNGVDGNGQVDWYALSNIHIMNFETSITLQGVIDSFNINTNQWVAWYVYKRLKWMGNKMVSFAITLGFVSLWHGIWPGYLLNFSLEFFGIVAERTFISTAKHMLGCSLSEMNFLVRIPLTVLAYVVKNLILLYPMAMFMLLSWSNCYTFMRAIYFYCHVILIGWLLIYYAFVNNYLRRSSTKKHE